MHDILPETGGDLVAVHIRGKLERSDYDDLVPLLENRIEQHGKIALYWETEDFEGWTGGGLAADLGFDIRHATDFTRVAMVGETRWEKVLSRLMSPFSSAEVRFFPPDRRTEAMDWVREARRDHPSRGG